MTKISEYKEDYMKSATIEVEVSSSEKKWIAHTGWDKTEKQLGTLTIKLDMDNISFINWIEQTTQKIITYINEKFEGQFRIEHYKGECDTQIFIDDDGESKSRYIRFWLDGEGERAAERMKHQTCIFGRILSVKREFVGDANKALLPL